MERRARWGALFVAVTLLAFLVTTKLLDNDPPAIELRAVATVTTSTTTTTAPPPTTAAPRRIVERAARSDTAVTSPPAAVSDVWHRLASCECCGDLTGSRIDLRAYNGAGPYYGTFQFLMSTWRSVGGKGDPRDATWAEQLHRAQLLQARSGWGQWPSCTRRLGLR